MMITKWREIIILGILTATGCASQQEKSTSYHDSKRNPAQAENQNTPDQISFFVTPEDLHHTWLDSINQAQDSIMMEMFHLTDPEIVQALRNKPSQVEINLILDSGNLKSPATGKIKDAILINRPNIHVYSSSGLPSGFTQTHTKAMIADDRIALITSINLTNNASVQRDYGIVTKDVNVIAEMTAVFKADIQNSKNVQNHKLPTRFTPSGVGQGMLIWSPVDSESRLVSLIEESLQIPDGPDKYLYATVENLGNAAIQNALSNAAKNNVQVRVIVPQCVLGANGPRNYDFFQYLTNGVRYRVMPHPSSPQQPYMHGKMMVLGNGRGYVGSVNYSKNSTQGNRELGIIFTNPQVSKQIKNIFDQDWIQAADVPDPSAKPSCPTNTSDPSQ